MRKAEYGFQDVNYVLNLFDKKPVEARRRYLEFVRKGIPEGRRHDLTGGGLVRSAGGVVRAEIHAPQRGQDEGR